MVAKSRTNRKKSMKRSKRSMRGGQLAPPAEAFFVNGQLTQTPPPSSCQWAVLGGFKLGPQASMLQGSTATGMLYLGGNKWTDMGASNESTTSLYVTKTDSSGRNIMTGSNALPMTIPPASGAQYYMFKLENKAKTSSCVFRIDSLTDGSNFRTPSGIQLVFQRKNGPNPTLQAVVGTPSFNSEVYTLFYALCRPREMPTDVIKYIRA